MILHNMKIPNNIPPPLLHKIIPNHGLRRPRASSPTATAEQKKPSQSGTRTSQSNQSTTFDRVSSSACDGVTPGPVTGDHSPLPPLSTAVSETLPPNLELPPPFVCAPHRSGCTAEKIETDEPIAAAGADFSDRCSVQVDYVEKMGRAENSFPLRCFITAPVRTVGLY